MFKTIKAKVTMYKWIIIISLFTGMGLFSVVQYYQADQLRVKTASLEEKNETLNAELVTIKREFIVYKDKVDDAVIALNDLRDVFSSISNDTASFEKRLRQLREMNKVPDQGLSRDIRQIEEDINKLSQDVFDRFESASKAEGAEK